MLPLRMMHELEKHEKIVAGLDLIIEDLEKEIKSISKINRNLEKKIEEMEHEEILTLAWLNAYPKEI